MNYTVTITSKRQITIPSELYKKFNLRQGEKLILEERGSTIVVSNALALVNKLAGSVSIPKHLEGASLDKAVKKAKNKYFKKRTV